MQITYSHRSVLRSPFRLIAAMISELRNCHRLAWELFKREYFAKYRESFLGFFWGALPPVLLAISFSFAQKSEVFSMKPTPIAYQAFVVLSVCLWQVFAEALNAPQLAMTQAKPYLTKVSFSREAIFVAKIYEVFFSFLSKIILIALTFVYFRVPVSSTLFLAPFGVLALGVLGFFLGLLLVPVSALVQDVSRALTVLLTYAMFVTPVVYSIPDSGPLAQVVRLNPVTPLLITTRELVLGLPLSFPMAFVLVFGLSLFGLFFAWLFCRISMPFLIERMGS